MTKLTKKAFSLAVAGFVAFTSTFGGTPITASANETETTKDVVLASADASEETYTVYYTAPDSWTGTVYAYAYYEVKENGKTELKEPLDYWPGTKATKVKGNTYSVEIPTTVGSANVVFSSVIGEVGTEAKKGAISYSYDCNVEEQFPGKDDPSLVVTGNSDISSDGKITPITPTETPVETTPPVVVSTPAVTASASPKPVETTPAVETEVPTEEPTSVPTVEPVVGPQVSVNVPNGTSYNETESDTMSVVISLKDGATSASYSIDNGPATTITKDTTVEIGEGKIANSDITLQVTSTDGTTTNTQTFHYYKKTSVRSANVVALSTAMVKLFDTVSSKAAETTFTVHFTPPENEKWTGKDISVYCYAYYDTKDEEGKTKAERLLGYWPGKKMEKDATGSGYSIPVSTKTGNAKIMFVSVKGELGELITEGRDEPGYDFTQIAQLPDGYVYDADGNKVKNPETGNDLFAEGVSITNETWFSVDADGKLTSKSATVAPASATPDVTAIVTPSAVVTTEPTPIVTTSTSPIITETAAPEFDAYFGAALSAPQYNTTTQTLSAVAVNAKNPVTYTFFVDGNAIGEATSNSYVAWNPSNLAAGTHTISVVITDGENTKTLTKKYTLVENPVPPTATPEVSDNPVETPIVTTTPSAVVSETPAVSDTPVITDVPVITEVPTAVPTVVPTAPATVSDSSITSDPTITTASAVKGTISFNKTKKTVGETVKISVKVTTGSAVKPYSYVYKATKSGKTTTIAKKTKKTSANWIPAAKGTYKISVLVYDANNKKVGTLTKNYTVKKRVITIKSFKTNKKSGQKKGTKITISAKATATAGKVKYKFIVKNSKGKTVASKSYSSKATKVWKAKAKGTYTITLYVKNGKGVEVSKVKTFKIK